MSWVCVFVLLNTVLPVCLYVQVYRLITSGSIEEKVGLIHINIFEARLIVFVCNADCRACNGETQARRSRGPAGTRAWFHGYFFQLIPSAKGRLADASKKMTKDEMLEMIRFGVRPSLYASQLMGHSIRPMCRLTLSSTQRTRTVPSQRRTSTPS